METIFTLVFTILTILGMTLAIKITGSMFVGILVAVIVIMIWKTVQVPLLILWDKFADKHFPLPHVEHFYKENYEGEPIGGLLRFQLGMRVLVVTETFEFTEERRDFFNIMIDAAKDALYKEYPMFKLRWLAVRKRQSPIVYSATMCGKDGEKMDKCYKAWNKTEPVYKLGDRKPNVDLFMYDGGIAIDGTLINYTAMFLFDNTLPKTVAVLDNIKTPENAADAAEAAAADAEAPAVEAAAETTAEVAAETAEQSK